VRAAFEHLAWTLDIAVAGIEARILTATAGMQQAFGALALCFREYQSRVHSQTLPIMS
jgi:hypothetical protein